MVRGYWLSDFLQWFMKFSAECLSRDHASPKSLGEDVLLTSCASDEFMYIISNLLLITVFTTFVSVMSKLG